MLYKKRTFPRHYTWVKKTETGGSMRLEVLLPWPFRIPVSRTWLGLCAKCMNMSTLGFHHGVASGWQKIEKQKSLHLDNSWEERWMAEQKQDTIAEEQRFWDNMPGVGRKTELGKSHTGRTRCDFSHLVMRHAWRSPGQEEGSVKITRHQVEKLPSSYLS